MASMICILLFEVYFLEQLTYFHDYPLIIIVIIYGRCHNWYSVSPQLPAEIHKIIFSNLSASVKAVFFVTP